MPYVIITALICVLSVTPNISMALSTSECSAIESEYGFIPAQCTTEFSDSDELVQGQLSLEQKENNVFFPAGGDKLDTSAEQQILLLSAVLETAVLKTACIQLIGHSSSGGPALNNQALGLRRAQAVALYLGEKLDDPNRVENIVSNGEDRPLENFSSRHRLQQRVSIMLRPCPILTP